MSLLSILVLFYDDPLEAAGLVNHTNSQLDTALPIQWVLASVDASRAGALLQNDALPENTQVIACKPYRGLPHAKNRALQEARGEFVLFLFPGLTPQPGAIERLLHQLRSHPEWGAVAGRWNNTKGNVEKGYNIRQFPTFLALLWDVLFVNKLFPSNRITRAYKMHDFDHNSACQADHASDCAFLIRRQLLVDLGGFDEHYRFGWFDQVKLCRDLRRSGYAIAYEPHCVFASTGRDTLVNRILAEHYADFYKDEQYFVATEFGFWRAKLFAAALALGMVIRLGFSQGLPRRMREGLLRHFRSYVDDGYIQGMRLSYRSLLKHLLRQDLKGG